MENLFRCFIYLIMEHIINIIMNSLNKPKSGKSNFDHHHLLIKQLSAQRSKYKIDIPNLVKQMSIDLVELDKEEKKELLHTIINRIKESEEGGSYIEDVGNIINERVNDMYTSQTRRATYFIDCLREATSFPFVKDRKDNIYNFIAFYKKYMSRQMRRLLWSKELITDQNKMNFQKYDRQITPYQVSEELKMTITKIASKQHFSLKQNQIDICLRIMEYFVKYYQKIPHRHLNYLTLLSVDLFSFFTISKVIEVGAVCLGLINLIEYYQEPNIQTRFSLIMKAIELVDEESYQFITTHYMNQNRLSQSKKQLNEAFELFRLTFGSCFLPYEGSQFVIDQLLIRKRCKFDMYVLFAIMIMILSDQFTVEDADKYSIKEIIQRCKEIIKVNDIVEAYSVIYEEIPAFFSPSNLKSSNNRLLEHMIAYSNQSEQADYQNQQPEINEAQFIIQLNSLARMGTKMN